MTGAQLHLLVNHIPVLTLVFGLPLLLISLLNRLAPDVRKGIRIAALLLIVIAGPFAAMATLSGEGAEESVEGLAVVAEADIHAHEEAAEFATWTLMILSLVALYIFVMILLDRPLKAWMWGILSLLLVFSIVVIARTAHLGGKIRHPEITSGWQAPAHEGNGDNGSEDWDD